MHRKALLANDKDIGEDGVCLVSCVHYYSFDEERSSRFLPHVVPHQMGHHRMLGHQSEFLDRPQLCRNQSFAEQAPLRVFCAQLFSLAELEAIEEHAAALADLPKNRCAICHQ